MRTSIGRRRGHGSFFGVVRQLRRFGRAESGATAVEFGIIAVPFLGLLAAIFESALVFFATQGLEAAVGDASRSILTGQAQTNSAITTVQQFRDTMICNANPRILPSFVDCSKVIIDVSPISSMSGFQNGDTTTDFVSNPALQRYCTGSPGDVVIVRAAYEMPVYLSIVALVDTSRSGQTSDGQGGWFHMIEGISAFRNEPFPNSPKLPGC